VLVGATLAGPAGAFVAVPAAAIVDILVREVVVPWRQDQIAEDDQDPVAVSLDRAARSGPRAAAR
jgi:predicted PurR-regulated permease PerM